MASESESESPSDCLPPPIWIEFQKETKEHTGVYVQFGTAAFLEVGASLQARIVKWCKCFFYGQGNGEVLEMSFSFRREE